MFKNMYLKILLGTSFFTLFIYNGPVDLYSILIKRINSKEGDDLSAKKSQYMKDILIDYIFPMTNPRRNP